ncbi:hypothetical protein BABINDRAFT_62148 [Babjeviella inositovora NRRL Y-12698]|uniref:Acyl-protein thioesterase 1 n=1 Tax=Babjeviella inositovora NRRL Y-12698 TaxID=984486 RepID=A0A1E3QQ56_9ASCO|nr:uncharacterized protein BABINDRAFT_62148 [Babjeviella inositovora NRRL Y-12698]ODQ79833.1 hypothetical protein BABINDRAFT_62148 [Babjeviella inositovora NRRL Y-12698]
MTYTKPVISLPAVCQTPPEAQYTVIFLHGLGDSGQGWSFIASAARNYKLDHFNFIFPSAPDIPSSLNFGMVIPAWYDLKSLHNVRADEDVDSIEMSLEYVTLLVEEEVTRGVPMEHIIVGGFSQGCALSLLLAATLGERMGGFIGLSGYIPMLDTVKHINCTDPDLARANSTTPIFLAHGEKDNAIKFELSRENEACLRDWGFQDITYKQYKGLSHSTNDEEIDDVMKWLVRVSELELA